MSKRASAGAPSGGGAKKSRKDDCGSERDLPDPQVMSHKAEATTGRVKSRQSKEHLSQTQDLLDENEKRLQGVSEDQNSWLIAKYGWSTPYSVGTCLRSLPCSLTEGE